MPPLMPGGGGVDGPCRKLLMHKYMNTFVALDQLVLILGMAIDREKRFAEM